jgi:tRNA pseudouridine32 synthase/23S rRNA pseudouridine746 synthase
VFADHLVRIGESKHLLQASLLGDATRGGTGDCCAPKLLHAAQRAGLRPLSMAEFWYGSPVGGRVEGRTYDACQERCQQLLGYMLCGSAG